MHYYIYYEETTLLPTNIINVKVREDGLMDGCLLLFHAKTNKRILVILYFSYTSE